MRDLWKQGEKRFVAFDAEGVDLSRLGTIDLVSIGILCGEVCRIFLFDLMGLGGSSKAKDIMAAKVGDVSATISAIDALKIVLEDPSVVKIVHDYRMDRDALYGHHGISLTSVFDTSVWESKLTSSPRRSNLNDTLLKHMCETNLCRVSKLFVADPYYW